MNCEQVCHLIDEYLENRLGQYERQQLENHVAYCPDCEDELRSRPAFERTMLRAMATSVQHLHVSPLASRRIVQAAQGTLGRAIWSRRVTWVAQALAAVAAVALVVVGALLMTGEIRVPEALRIASQPQEDRPASSLTFGDMYVEPQKLGPGEPFSVIILLHSDLPQDLDSVRLDLSIAGPTGDYRFALNLTGPLPAYGVSVLEVTPELLADPCWEQYKITPAEITRMSGLYTIRARLFRPVTSSGR